MIYLLSDVGSTYTKVLAIDFEQEKVLGFAKSFTTINSDIKDGFNNAVTLLKEKVGNIDFNKTIISSSAKGGLKMVSVGLVPDLTVKASKLAATSAGAKLYKSFSYELTKDDLEEIEKINPEILLLTGGIDGGNTEIILKNAKSLSTLKSDFAVVYAGNRTCKEEVIEIFQNKKDLRVATNVMPVFNKLEIEDAKNCIRKLFIEKIILAKGFENLQAIADNSIMPTPLAFMNGLELLGEDYGEILAFDIGGATCDVYSINEGLPQRQSVVEAGLKEPKSKRTVEGDIGMRYSLSFFLEDSILENISNTLNYNKEDIEKYLKHCIENPDYLPQNDFEKDIEILVTKQGISESTKRHCGYLESSYTPLGEVFVQHGKDLTNTKTIIGAGGAIVTSSKPKEILEMSLYKIGDGNLLKPIKSKFLIDRKNCITSLGLLINENKEIKEKAIKIFQKDLEML